MELLTQRSFQRPKKRNISFSSRASQKHTSLAPSASNDFSIVCLRLVACMPECYQHSPQSTGKNARYIIFIGQLVLTKWIMFYYTLLIYPYSPSGVLVAIWSLKITGTQRKRCAEAMHGEMLSPKRNARVHRVCLRLSSLNRSSPRKSVVSSCFSL